MNPRYLAEVPVAVRERAERVRLVALDVDGTLTDGRLRFSSDGSEIKAFHALDGQGLKLLRESGIEVALITARSSELVARRAAELGIVHVHQGCHDKRAALRALCQILSIEPAQVAYMGDDLPDLPALALSGLAVGPSSAAGGPSGSTGSTGSSGSSGRGSARPSSGSWRRTRSASWASSGPRPTPTSSARVARVRSTARSASAWRPHR